MNLPAFEYIQDPGDGNLNLRAYIASIVGPRRIANAQRNAKTIPVDGVGKSNKIADNGVRNQSVCSYVEVWLAQSELLRLPSGVWISFYGASDGSSSVSTGDRVLLSPAPGPGDRYRAILLPQEGLSAAALSQGDGTALPGDVHVVVATVNV